MLSVSKAEGCAWRGRYVTLTWPWAGIHESLLVAVILDPGRQGIGVRPVLLLRLPIGWYRTASAYRVIRKWDLEIPLPYIAWRYPMGRVWLWLYRWSQAFWHRVDGRRKGGHGSYGSSR